MSGIRHRVAQAASPSVDTVEKLSATLRQVKETASSKGVSKDDLAQCVFTVAKKKLKPPQVKPVPSSAPRRGCCYRLCQCWKVLWIALLMMLAFSMVIIASKSANFFVHKVVHTHIYYIARPIRSGISSVLPYMRAVGLDIFASDCLIENPLLSDADSCPCLHIKEAIELELNHTHRIIPEGILAVPNTKVYVVRKAVDTAGFSLSLFERFRNKMMPDTCFEMTSEDSKGVQIITDLFNSEVVERYLDVPDSWSFSWQECPTKVNPRTYRSLLPQTEWLPPNVEMANTTYFTLSSKWAKTSHDVFALEGARFVAVLVLLGDIRFMMEPANSACFYNCASFRKPPVLYAGDLLIFDQTYWGYLAVTWTRSALTSTVTLYPQAT